MIFGSESKIKIAERPRTRFALLGKPLIDVRVIRRQPVGAGREEDAHEHLAFGIVGRPPRHLNNRVAQRDQRRLSAIPPAPLAGRPPRH
jgi:hypothetical protein